ncbi:helicase-related protein [Desulfovibrio sp. QI0430]
MDFRSEIMIRLAEDLIGPYAADELLKPRSASGGMLLQSRPSDLYLAGMLWPQRTQMAPEEDERLGIEGEDDDGNTSQSPEAEQAPFASMMRPSSAGLSFATRFEGNVPLLDLTISFGMYSPETFLAETNDSVAWRRKQHTLSMQNIAIKEQAAKIRLNDTNIPKDVYLYARKVATPQGAIVSIVLVNGIQLDAQAGREDIEKHTLFQVEIVVRPSDGTQLVARPSRRPDIDDDDKSMSLLYRSKLEFATGHTCSARWEVSGGNPDIAELVATSWIPQSKILDTDSAGHEVFQKLLHNESKNSVLSASWLSHASDKELGNALSLLSGAYGEWLDMQERRLATPELAKHLTAAQGNITACRRVQARMLAGAKKIERAPSFALAFRLANQAMLQQYRWKKSDPKAEMNWRPFQLGFILLSTTSTLLDPVPEDSAIKQREIMDLLWFPTGGGKTEAYLGLVAMLMFHRRLKFGPSPDTGAGVAAIMRYTLRLLTTQQFMRASALVFACELIRKDDEARLGTVPFSIGLWVGKGATPNTIIDAEHALGGDKSLASPAQLTQCPLCKNSLTWQLAGNPREVHARCTHKGCKLATLAHLPIWTVDEDIYRHCPSLLIGTVDKFAQLVRKEATNSLFGVDKNRPPDLIVQDELHLISGPLGSLTGLYEALIDRLFSNNEIRPKIVGSTATIRKASEQVLALYNRATEQFPPACLDAEDSGFAVAKQGSSGRIYLGVTTAGRSAKFALQAVSASLLQSVYALSQNSQSGTATLLDNWWTLVAYFNSLRELGGALVLMQDDVHDAITTIAHSRKEKRREPSEVRELTSRLSQDEVRDMLDDLEIKMDKDGALDIVLASSMLSVGVDISRLGLMVVNGQPKGMSEYIQATSRVGRGDIPGLIVSILNNAKSRDRSHYENFSTWHESLYRDVEPASVTPFAPRARDKALHAIVVGLIRHIVPKMLTSPNISLADQQQIDLLMDFLRDRAHEVDPEETTVRDEIYDILDWWRTRGAKDYWNYKLPGSSLLQGAEDAATKCAAGQALGDARPTPNSMRTVEPSVPFRLK